MTDSKSIRVVYRSEIQRLRPYARRKSRESILVQPNVDNVRLDKKDLQDFVPSIGGSNHTNIARTEVARQSPIHPPLSE
jgi:hypothetical protein